ncbi:MAG: sulfate adenylyltransferase subunit 1 [Caulobacteraceae bacterium]
MQDTEKLKIVIVGHVDHGKSTLIGRLLFDTNSLPKDKLTELERISNKMGKQMEFSFLLDHLQEEREQGITIDTTQIFFKTETREYVIIDAPGHVEFIRNMITGAAQADAGVLIIDASEGIREQTMRHAFILSLLRLDQIIVVVNKMDLVDFDMDVYNNILTDIQLKLKTLNLNIKDFIPISAIQGDNISKKSTSMNWYQGPTFLEALNDIGIQAENEGQYPILPIQDVYKLGDKRIAVGRLETGRLAVGDSITLYPTLQETRIRSIEKFLENGEQAEAKESIGVTTADPVFIERGSIICSADAALQTVQKFNASIFVMTNTKLDIREKLVIKCATQEAVCEINKVFSKMNSATLEYINDETKSLKGLEFGQVELITKKPITVTEFNEAQTLGRFVIVKNNNICAGGIVTGI